MLSSLSQKPSGNVSNDATLQQAAKKTSRKEQREVAFSVKGAERRQIKKIPFNFCCFKTFSNQRAPVGLHLGANLPTDVTIKEETWGKKPSAQLLMILNENVRFLLCMTREQQPLASHFSYVLAKHRDIAVKNVELKRNTFFWAK